MIFVMLLLLFLSPNGHAEEGVSPAYWLESSGVSGRSEALEVQRVAEELGLEARLSKHYGHGGGWTYTVVVDGLSDPEVAETAARELSERVQLGISVYTHDSSDVDVTEPSAGSRARVYPAPEEVLLRLARSHGGRSGGVAQLAEADRVSFSYLRELSVEGEPSILRHHWSRDGDDHRLEIERLEGQGHDQRLWVEEDRGWLNVDDGEPIPRDAAILSSVIERLGPGELLAWPLDLSRVALDLIDEELSVVVVGEGSELRFVVEHTDSEGSLRLVVDPNTWLLTRVEITGDAGEQSIQFSGWREVSTNLVVPWRTESLRGGQVLEVVRIESLELNPADMADAGVPPSPRSSDP